VRVGSWRARSEPSAISACDGLAMGDPYNLPDLRSRLMLRVPTGSTPSRFQPPVNVDGPGAILCPSAVPRR